ncbi:hypothetical protein AB0O20_27585 [Streptomyces kronopolitis]|uniref:hypothetical protein n=1 Tax=Streptomyces kronopolitis TaxID=1612435 RepID=UPI0034249D5F
MSARVTLHCDRLFEYSGCASQLITDARSVEAAHAAGERLGWLVRPDGTTYCPRCSGSARPRPAAAVIPLHPPTKETDRA